MREEQTRPVTEMPDGVEDGISHAATLLRFLEETAGNYGTRLATPACTGENGYSVEGWAGMNAILGLARQGLESLIADPPESGSGRRA